MIFKHSARLTGFLFLLSAANMLPAQQPVRILVNGYAAKQVIDRNIYGHFAENLGRCIYDGFWRTDDPSVAGFKRIRMDVVEALKKIKVPNLRWPGGCFADEYHWQDGIGPYAKRTRTVNTTWGNVIDDNSFGTHEFMELCRLIGCEPYIAGNVGSGTVEEMEKWVEYLNSDIPSSVTAQRAANGRNEPWRVSLWGVGNESWGCGGQMTPEFYANQYKRYANFCKTWPNAPRIKKIASGANSEDYNWTEVLMKNIPANQMWGVSLHYYTVPKTWADKGSATSFPEAEYFSAMRNCLHMDELVTRNCSIMDRYDPARRVALAVDEWGIWTNVEPGTNSAFLYQQNSMRDALIAASTLNIFNNHCDRVRLANLAQAVNVLQSIILTDKDRMVLTPTYHVFDLYQVHQGATMIPLQFSSPDYVSNGQSLPAVNASASKDSEGMHLSLVNIDPAHTITINAVLEGLEGKTVTGRILTSAKFTDVNTFDEPSKVRIVPFTGASKEGNNIRIELPPLSVVMLEVK